jgi:hypothetical protein
MPERVTNADYDASGSPAGGRALAAHAVTGEAERRVEIVRHLDACALTDGHSAHFAASRTPSYVSNAAFGRTVGGPDLVRVSERLRELARDEHDDLEREALAVARTEERRRGGRRPR